MKEQTIATLNAGTLPQALRGLVDIVPDATWNGYNVWAKFSNEEEAKSLGFALSKNGKHAGQYFTNERLQLSLAKKRAEAEKKALTPPPVKESPKAPQAPKAIPAPPAPPAAKSPVESQADDRTEFCAVVGFDIEGHDVHNINLFRVTGCTPEEFKEYVESLERQNKKMTVTDVNILPKVYKTDSSFRRAFKNMKLYKNKDFFWGVQRFDGAKYKQRKAA